MLCKGDHLLWSCLGIPKVLEVWSACPQWHFLSASCDHVSDKQLTSNNKSLWKKGKVKFSYNLCEGSHPIQFFPLTDEASKVLENLVGSQPRLPTRYWKLSPNPSLLDRVINQNSSLVKPALSQSESHESILNQLLVDKMVGLTPPLINHTFQVESGPHTS